MTSREERARQIQSQIREILLRDWDPIGVRQETRAQDEYDGYVGASIGSSRRGRRRDQSPSTSPA